MARRGGQNMGGYISRAQREGVSQAETMRTLRGAGFSFSDNAFRSAWGEIEHARALRGNIADAPLNRRVSSDLESPIQGGKQGDRLYRFDLFVRRRGEREVLRTHMAVKSSRSIALATALSTLVDSFADNEDVYGSELIAAIPAAVNIFTGE